MKIDRGLILAGGLAVAASACASAGTGTAAPGASAAASVPALQCAAGAPAATQFATASQAALNRTAVFQGPAATPYYTTAMEQARAGIAADAANPLHHYLAAQAAIGLNNYAAADSAFRRTLELCPGAATEVTPLRQRAALMSFNAGVEAYNQRNDTTAALAAWQTAGQLNNELPQTYLNQGVVYSARGDAVRAAAAYRETLAAAERASRDTARAADAASARADALAGLVNVGAQLFTRNQFAQAGEIFSSVHAADPNNRDAWYNHALALYRLQRWNDLIPVANEVIRRDPLNYNARIIQFNAYKGLSDAAKAARNTSVERTNRDLALSTLTAADQLPVQMQTAQLSTTESQARIAGTVVGATARAGTPINLEFTFYGPAGAVGTQRVTVNAPAKDQPANFEVVLPTTAPVTGYSYRVVS
ncbi:MAG TPA: tetratricopeptide repeat protein [Longimicrobium sp.]|nr:tetratricopeptide repeat protein [Longimicrobium sp.]